MKGCEIMSRSKTFPARLNIPITELMSKEIKAIALVEDKDVSVLVRSVLNEFIQCYHAERGIDAITGTIRRVIRDELKPVENRMAKLSAKGAVAAATSMYLNVQTIQDMGKNDAVELYDKARSKAVYYIRKPDDID